MNERKLEKILKSIANKRRLAILKVLKLKKEMSVGEIAKEIKLSFKSTSRHLNILISTDVVERKQVGLMMFYRLPGKVNQILEKVISAL